MKVLMTAFKHGVDSIINWQNLDNFVAQVELLGITPQPVRGFWKGEAEPSFMIEGVKPQQVKRFYELARQYNQDAILLVADDARCALVETDGPVMKPMQDVGDWREVSREIAVQFDAYTETRDGRYFVAAHRDDVADKTRRLLATHASVIAAQEYQARLADSGIPDAHYVGE